jgi:oligoendopeptidase F
MRGGFEALPVATEANAAAMAVPGSWDLRPIAPKPGLLEALDALLQRCHTFRDLFKGRVGTLDPSGFADLLAQLGRLRDEISRVSAYLALRVASGEEKDDSLDALVRAQATLMEVVEIVRFFELEWLSMPERGARRILDNPSVSRDRHFLMEMRRFRPHMLSAEEEAAIAAREPVATEAWAYLQRMTLSSLRIPSGPAELTIDEALAARHDADRTTRVETLRALYEALRAHADVLAHCYDTVVADRLALDRLRGFKHPRFQADLENQIDPALVDEVLQSVEAHYAWARTWFRTKAGWLGLQRLTIADELAPLGESPTTPWPEGAALIIDSLKELSPEIARVAEKLFAGGAIDAQPRHGKSTNAFCMATGTRSIPYVSANYTGRFQDLVKLAHELGHALHYVTAGRHQTPLSFDASILVSELGATFLELYVWDRAVRCAAGDRSRLHLAAERLQASHDAVFRQTMITRFEEEAYRLRSEGVRLSADRLSTAWLERSQERYGSDIELTDGYGLDWARVEHIVHGRFYNYAYVMAHLASLAMLHADREGSSIGSRWVGLLERGGSAGFTELMEDLGLSGRESPWELAFQELDRQREVVGQSRAINSGMDTATSQGHLEEEREQKTPPRSRGTCL